MIDRNEIKGYSLEMLSLLEREKINSIDGLQGKIGESFRVSGGIVQLEAGRGGLRILPTDVVLMMSYIVHGKGIPIEVRFNVNANYSRITIKFDSEMEGYTRRFYDPLGNVIQDKKFELSFERVIGELKRLSQ